MKSWHLESGKPADETSKPWKSQGPSLPATRLYNLPRAPGEEVTLEASRSGAGNHMFVTLILQNIDS